MARTGRSESVRLLEAAYASGITHFDVARSYGYGEAESALGDFLEAHREEVTLTTKAGIVPPRRSTAMSLTKAAARRTTRLAPGLRRILRQRAGAMVSHGRFGAGELRASLETSLRELRTDHIDLLLLHECRPEDLHDALLPLLHSWVANGTIGTFGVATDRAAAAAVAHEWPALAQAVQVPDSVVDEPLPIELGRPLLTHSVLGRGLQLLRHTLEDPGRRAAWSTDLDVDLTANGALETLMLEGALARNPGGTVLVSSRNPRHIAHNAAVERAPASTQRSERFRELVEAAQRTGELDRPS